MIKRAPRPDSGFLILRNDVARDERLSYRASGLLTSILSRPDNWTVTAERLAAERPNGEGEKAVRATLRELEAAGYLVRQRTRGADGRFGWVQMVYDTPQTTTTGVTAGQTISPLPPGGFPPGGNRRSQEEPRGRTVEEDVLHRSASSRFTPSGGSDNDEDQQTIAETDNPEAGGAQFEDWRSADRALFKALVGDHLTTDGTVWTPAGTYNTDMWYDALRKQKRKPIRWPGRFFNELDDRGGIEEWLAHKGLEAA